jgi:hypothetical protein
METWRQSYPVAWIGHMVEMSSAPDRYGRLIDVNAFGITYEADGNPERIRFVPWVNVGFITPERPANRA